MQTRKFWLLCISFLLFVKISNAQSTSMRPTRVLFIFDASGSMAGKWKNGNKMDMAKKIITHLSDSLDQERIPYAVRVFGHQSDRKFEDCKDSKLEIALSANNKVALSNLLQKLEPRGHSPIALSLENAVQDFPISKLEQRPVIILISDGFENCAGDACAASEKLQAAGIFFRPYIIGLGLSDEQKKQFECVGQLVDVQENDLQLQNRISEVVINQIMNPSSLQINLLNQNEKASESNVNMSFFNERNEALKYNFYHTMNNAGQSDSLFIDPSIRYKVKIHTLPSVEINRVELSAGQHVIKAVEAGQGILKLQMNGNQKAKNILCVVKKDGKIINAQELNTSKQYLVGEYDLEVLSIPVLKFPKTQISQSQTKTIVVPNPGMLQISKQVGYMHIQRKNDEHVMETIYIIDPNSRKESLPLLPGNYEIVFRPKSSISSRSTVVKKISIVSGTAASLIF